MTLDMTQGKPAKLILRFAVPLLAGMLIQQLYNLFDTMIVGRFLGVEALAGVGATGPINFLVLGFCMGICAGFSIPVAQMFGAREEQEMRRYAANGVWLCAMMGAVITVITVVYCRDILVLMGTPQDCMDQAYSYILVIFAGIPFSLMYNLLAGYLRSLGDSKTPLVILVFSCALNIGLDLFMIISLGLGVSGAALATVLSQAISGVLCLLFILFRVRALHVRRGEWRLEGSKVRKLCACGVPMGLQYSITAIGSVILQTAVNSLGSAAVAAVTASGRITGFLGCPLDGLGSTMSTYTAQNVGARKYERINQGIITATIIGFIYSAVAMVVAWCFGGPLAHLFVSGDGAPELIEMAHSFMSVGTLFYPFLALVNIVRFMIQGMGFSVFAILAGVMEMIARAAAGMLLVPAFGFTGAAFGNPLAWVLADVFLIPAYFRCLRILRGQGHHSIR